MVSTLHKLSFRFKSNELFLRVMGELFRIPELFERAGGFQDDKMIPYR